MLPRTQIISSSAKNDDAKNLQTLLFAHPEMLTAPICRSTHTALTLSAVHSSHSVIAMLLSHNTPPDLRASRSKLPTALCISCASGDAIAVEMLIRGGARVRWCDVEQQEPLHYALQAWKKGAGDAHRVVEVLVEAGALDESKEMGGTFADGDIYPPQYAVRHGVSEAISVMLQANETSKGSILAAMQVRGLGALACSEGNPQLLATLIKAGYDVSCTDSYRQTLMHHAMNAPVAQILPLVQLLLRTKLDLRAQDAFGRTALHIAKQRNLPPVVSLLRGLAGDDHSFSSMVLTPHAAGTHTQHTNREYVDELRSTGQLRKYISRRTNMMASQELVTPQRRAGHRFTPIRSALRSMKGVINI